MMKIYTKKGDAGETGLYGGARVSKDDLRIQTYGTIDELNAALGLVLAHTELAPLLRSRLVRVQGELFQLGAELATPDGKKTATLEVGESSIQALEAEIDEMELKLSPLKTFILPGGSVSSAHLHLARTISRRAERELVTLHRNQPQREVVLQYMNRLSDYLFVCARFANFLEKIEDTPWIAP